MSMAHSCNVLRCGAIFHRQNTFGNHLSGDRSDDVDAENLVSCAVGENLDEAFGIVDSFRAGVRHKWEASDFVADVLGLEVFFRLANPSDFGVSVDHRRDAVVVDVHILKN